MKILEHSDGGQSQSRAVERDTKYLSYRFCWLWIAEVKHSLRRSPYECSRTWWWGQRPSRAVRRDRPRAVVGLASPKPSQTTGTKVISLNKCIWKQLLIPTVCPRSSRPFYIVTYHIKWATTSWTHSMRQLKEIFILYVNILKIDWPIFDLFEKIVSRHLMKRFALFLFSALILVSNILVS